MKAYVVFDLDGTLVESLPGIAEGLNRALQAVGRAPYPPEAVRGMIGRGAVNLCAAALGYADSLLAPAAELEALHAAFRREYPECWQGEGTKPFPGIPGMLLRLMRAGAHLAILTNKPQEVTGKMVATLFPDVLFEHVFGQVEGCPRKPDPAALYVMACDWGVPVSDITLVGDSLIDARTVGNARCGGALVTWGYADTRELRAAGGCPLFSTVKELERHLLG